MKIRLFLGAVVLIALGGCLKKPTINLKKIQHLNTESKSNSKQTDGISVAVKKFSSQECQEVFGTNLLEDKEPIVPVQISIENKSGDFWYLKENSIDFKTIDKKIIENRLKSPGRGTRSLFFCLGLIGAVSVAIAPLSAFIGASAYLIYTVPSIIYPGIVASIFIGAISSSFVMYKVVSIETSAKKIDSEIKEFIKSSGISKESLVIPDKSDVDLIFFVHKKDLPNKFDFTLFGQNKALTFNLVI